MMQRRTFLTTLAAAGATAIATPLWAALNEASASALINKLVGDINKAIDSGKGKSAMFRDFEKIFARYSDTKSIAAYTMGVDARRATPAQRKAYSKAFQSYISRKYGSRFREFIGGRLEVTGVKKVKRWYEVSCVAYLRGESPFEVTFLVSDRSGKPLFFNMYIEGVNLLLTERTEIGAIIDRNGGDIDKMIAELKNLG
ncbi:putative phospholipid-binding protein MlaC precursor [Tritonibacter multivorans]|uniref:Putative phospholipid-binding protein MlaC n=2 Tax=Tritonibacter multivorans TaxID=928856 RepID=A0A0N7LZ13_9RHOB|nr:putative phospholipid-binding protein MlaC precursor [Tritonibacter multivorans]SFD38860.1 phospholipid transport system substrate-binding protein [Tritonibacter multivorans]